METVHDPNPKFKCNVCGKGFKYKNNFLEHVKVVHEGKRDFKCDTCGKEFVRLSYLQKHQNSAHDIVSEVKPSDDRNVSQQLEGTNCQNINLIWIMSCAINYAKLIPLQDGKEEKKKSSVCNKSIKITLC